MVAAAIPQRVGKMTRRLRRLTACAFGDFLTIAFGEVDPPISAVPWESERDPECRKTIAQAVPVTRQE
jgi:hypothetical protein